MSSDPSVSPDAEKATGNRTLRTCLIVGVGCAGILAIGFCIVLALGIPVFRSVLDNVDWEQGRTIIDALSGDLEGVLDATLPEEPGEGLLDGLEGTLEASFPEEFRPDVNFQGVSFSYPDGEDYGAVPAVVPALLDVEWANMPEHMVFPLDRYLLQDRFHEPRILIISTQELLAANSSVEPGLDELRDALGAQPRNIERVPFVMPGFNAAQMITTQVDYLAFEGGQGVRFVTQYGQAAWPINNHDLFYAFQGLTDDGAYLVTAILPVTHPSLPVDGETAIAGDYEAFIAGYEASLAQTKAELDSHSPDSFVPSLDALDAMLASLQIEAP